jgi:hypothetical protein
MNKKEITKRVKTLSHFAVSSSEEDALSMISTMFETTDQNTRVAIRRALKNNYTNMTNINNLFTKEYNEHGSKGVVAVAGNMQYIFHNDSQTNKYDIIYVDDDLDAKKYNEKPLETVEEMLMIKHGFKEDELDLNDCSNWLKFIGKVIDDCHNLQEEKKKK